MNEHASALGSQFPIAVFEQRFWAMQQASRELLPPARAERKSMLRALREILSDHSDEFVEAIAKDYGWRSHDETRMAELIPAITLVNDSIGNLSKWMRPTRPGRSVVFWPGRKRVYSQPKGVVLIIAPWNYPLLLMIGPLAAALAAGNRVIVKPSEFTPRTAEALKRRVEAALGTDRVTVATGGAEMAEALCRLPFDHILFTGSAAVGRKVLQAAAPNLTPVTLELGGKSPAIVHEDFDLALAADRIVRGKLLNAGQTCIAPDYALVPESHVEALVHHVQKAVARLYPTLIKNPDYTAIINARHYERLVGLVDDARANGARVMPIDPGQELADGEIGSSEVRKMLPVIVTGGNDVMTVAREEIFGPVLPIVSYKGIDDAIAYVNSRPRPLALYYFDTARDRIQHVLERTISGGATINDTIYHIAQESLPFGGIGPSGMGAYHGHEGFRTFSHAKGTFLQSRYTMTSLLTPPYKPVVSRLIRFSIQHGIGSF